MAFSVVIPSRNLVNLRECVAAIARHEPLADIIVIWDAPKTPASPVSDLWAVQGLLNELAPHRGMVLRGVEPFVFARNVNVGIRAAGGADVILLNDDALLETRGGFTAMHKEATVHVEYGLVSATTNLAGNPAQMRIPGRSQIRTCPSLTPGNSFATVAFVCVLIPRSTINEVGLLDERFTAYGWEDNDYCRRLRDAQRLIGICDGCFVDHASLHSTFRGDAYAAGDINAGRNIYMKKWGSM